MGLFNVLFLIGAVIYFIYKYGTKNFGYWKSKGVRELNPKPFVGDQLNLVLKKCNGIEFIQTLYNPFKSERFGGIYMFRKPFLVVTDHELLKQIMVKDSEYFVNRHDWTQSSDPLFNRNLVVLKDDKWRKMRAVMTTVFTSSKMKDMFKFMEKCADQCVQHLENKINQQKKINPRKCVVEEDMKDFFSRYGTDVIASTAFGVEVDSFKNPENEFYSSGETIRHVFQGNGFYKFLLLFAFPFIATKMKISFFGEKCNNFFINIVSETIRQREAKNIIRKDVIHILMEARKGKRVNENGELAKGKLENLTDLDITAQAIIFFLAGFETISSVLAFAAYELAANPDIQEKLYQEIEEVVAKENGVTYDGVIHQMEYLDMVFKETLRKWPSATMTDRVVTKRYVIPKTDVSPQIVLDKDDIIFVPIAAFHYDPEFFPNPHKFDPERFRDEKNSIKPFTYLPFGEGPRHCIGMRYALMEAKTVLVQLLRRFRIVPTEKTQIPLKLKKMPSFMIVPEKGHYVGLELRN